MNTVCCGVDGSKIEKKQIGHKKVHDNTVSILGDESEEEELEEIVGNSEGFVVYIAMKYKKKDDMELTLNIEKFIV